MKYSSNPLHAEASQLVADTITTRGDEAQLEAIAVKLRAVVERMDPKARRVWLTNKDPETHFCPMTKVNSMRLGSDGALNRVSNQTQSIIFDVALEHMAARREVFGGYFEERVDSYAVRTAALLLNATDRSGALGNLNERRTRVEQVTADALASDSVPRQISALSLVSQLDGQYLTPGLRKTVMAKDYGNSFNEADMAQRAAFTNMKAKVKGYWWKQHADKATLDLRAANRPTENPAAIIGLKDISPA